MRAPPSETALAAQGKTIRTQAVGYEHEGTRLKGFLAYDDAVTGKRPGVLVFPEWWGVNELAKTRARRLAELGYVALAADVNGEGRVIDITHPEDAATQAATLRADPSSWRGRALAALKVLTDRPDVDASKVAAIGFCLDSALQLAYTGAALTAVATFHSALPTPTASEATSIQARLLVCTGGADAFIPERAIVDFRAALGSAGVALDFVSYDGVLHSFTSPDADTVGDPGMRYDEHAAEDSWNRMKELFTAAFGK